MGCKIAYSCGLVERGAALTAGIVVACLVVVVLIVVIAIVIRRRQKRLK